MLYTYIDFSENKTRRSPRLDAELQNELFLLNKEIDAIQLGTKETEHHIHHGVDLHSAVAEVEVNEPTYDRAHEQKWTYQNLRELLAQLNTGIYIYAEMLTSQISKLLKFKSKYIECDKRKTRLDHDLRIAVQDKIKLQESLDDLQAKYNALQQVFGKVRDLNADNRQVIDQLRANRDRCVQSLANRKKSIDTLRAQSSELRRKLAHYRALRPE